MGAENGKVSSFIISVAGEIDMKLLGASGALLCAIGSLGVCSCALIFQGTTEKINVASEPPGATVTLNDGETKVTPFSMTAPREKDLQFHFSKPGYQSADLADNSQVEPAFLVVDFIPLVIPWAIDASAGAGYEHQQSDVIAHLDPESGVGGEVPGNAAVPLAPSTRSGGR
ncbi:hypothetical protein [Candidatus Binatus sp.]|uniref:hypothetical protein n=1 Tax=Candidatus Binatus sp. TaxID=2811406 RepID=UPI003CAD6840